MMLKINKIEKFPFATFSKEGIQLVSISGVFELDSIPSKNNKVSIATTSYNQSE